MPPTSATEGANNPISPIQSEELSSSPPIFWSTPHGTQLAYHYHDSTPDKLNPKAGILFLNGFLSTMNGTKALSLQNHCHATGRPYCRFDYSRVGASSTSSRGSKNDSDSSLTISIWFQDALSLLDHLVELNGNNNNPKRQWILVGSSMGAWLALQVAMQRSEMVGAVVGLAAASPDFVQKHLLTPKQLEQVNDTGSCRLTSQYDQVQGFEVTREFLQDAQQLQLLDQKRLSHWPPNVPVRLIHGQADVDIPWSTSAELVKILQSSSSSEDCHDAIQVHLISDGDHRLSRPQDLQFWTDILEELGI